MRAVLALVLLVLVSPAAAQFDDRVVVSAAADSLSASADAPSSMEVVVEYRGTSLGPLSQPRSVHVRVDGAPPGWTVTVDPAVFDLLPGEKQSVVLTAAVAPATEARRAELTVTALLAPRAGLPGTEPFDPVSTAHLDLTVHRADALTRTVLETMGAWVYVVLLALLATSLLAGRLLFERSRRAVAVDCAHPEQKVAPGAKGSFELLVENRSGADETVVLHVSEPPPGWAAFLPTSELSLRADHVESLELFVIAPKDARPGERVPLRVVAAGSNRPTRPDVANLEVLVAPQRARN